MLLVLLLIPVCLSAYQLHAHQSATVTTRTAPRSHVTEWYPEAEIPGAAQTVAELAGLYQQVQGEVDAYLAAVESARVEAERAAQAAQRATQTVSRAPVSISGDCAPVAAIIGWGIVNRESGGNPGAVNPSSGAIGCSQTLPSHYNSGGTCAGLDMYSVAGQTECTQRLYDASGLRPWAL